MNLLQRLQKKATQTVYSKYHIVAVGFTKKGNVVDVVTNAPAYHPKTFNTHAECRLMCRYGSKMSKIVIVRFGNSGNKLPIHPCPQCKALAESYNIKIESL